MSQHVSPRQWIAGARPRTWANAFGPVIAGTGVAAYDDAVHWGKAFLALIVAWALIIGVNYANDYSDGIRGTDADRTGPLRLTASGIAHPHQVRNAAFAAFGVAALAGIWLAALSSWWLVAVGALSILAAWTYTGGKNPYGYKGYGEVSVFLFFGLVAVMGTAYSQTASLTWLSFWVATAVGATSAAVNLANNLRDIPTDRANQKITLAVRLGDARTRRLYQCLVATPLLVSVLLGICYTPWTLFGLLCAPLAWYAAQPVRRNAQGAHLIPVLATTGRVLLLWSLITAVTLAL